MIALSPTTTKQEFGRYLRALRHARKLTIEQLAELADLSGDGVARCERGHYCPTLGTLLRLAAALNLKTSELMEGFEEWLESQTKTGDSGEEPPVEETEKCKLDYVGGKET